MKREKRKVPFIILCKWTTAHMGGWCAKIYCFSGVRKGVRSSLREKKNNSLVRAAPAHCPRIFSELSPSSRCFPGRVILLLCACFLPLKELLQPPSHPFCLLLLFDYLPAIVSLSPLHCVPAGARSNWPDPMLGRLRCIIILRGKIYIISAHRRYGIRESTFRGFQ